MRVLQQQISKKASLLDNKYIQKLYLKKTTRSFQVPFSANDSRLDKFLVGLLNIRREKARKMILNNQVSVIGSFDKKNNKIMPHYTLNTGDTVTIEVLKRKEDVELSHDFVTALYEKQVKELRSRIIYKDDRIIVLDKPHGLATQGGSKTHDHVDKLLDGLGESEYDDLKLVHRLDKRTSGLLIIARNKSSAAFLGSLFANSKIEKKVTLVITLMVVLCCGIHKITCWRGTNNLDWDHANRRLFE
jgi:23S rRNA-/tRNA-specific pseudouridylate synthase